MGLMEMLRKNLEAFLTPVLTAYLLAFWILGPAPLHAQAKTGDTLETPKVEFVFEELVTLGPSEHPGKTPWGERNIVPITGGTVAGPNIKGTVMPGGWDWQISAGGCNRLKADYMLKTDDGVIINVLNRATMCSDDASTDDLIMTAPVFEAPLGRYQWLNGGVYVGSLKVTTFEGRQAVRIRIYRVR